MNNIITRSQIKSLGKKLRSSSPKEKLKDSELILLNDWRSHHNSSLSYFAKVLAAQAKSLGVNKNHFTITQRLKRIHSIILKLRRFPQMQLSTMDDIAGLRIVLPSQIEVGRLMTALKERKSNHSLIKVNNYLMHPKEDGYRSMHAVYRIEKEPTIQIEIQLRSQLQHCWATGIEVFGTLEKTSFKTGEGAQEWRDFFELLSSRFALKEGLPILEKHEILSESELNLKLVSMIRKLNIIEQLNIYTSVYQSDWRKNRAKGRSGKFALLTLDTAKNSTKVEIYPESKLNEALEKYTAIEKIHHSSHEINVVLVNLDNMENLEKAYPNYFMDTKVLSKHLAKIVLDEF